jgi:hypothetical protein
VKYLQQNEWINDEIRESIRKRDFYHKKKDMCNYRLWRNNVKYLVETSKPKYYTNIIANMKGKVISYGNTYIMSVVVKIMVLL